MKVLANPFQSHLHNPTSRSRELTRRAFLQATATGSAGLIVAFYLGAEGASATPANKSFAPNAFIEITREDEIRLWVARSEMGQGVRTSMTMILADELDADWARVKIMQADFDAKYGDMVTGGSMSVRSCWAPLRKAGATAREMLVSAAQQTWNVPRAECSTRNGAVVHAKSKRVLKYGGLVEKASAVPEPKGAPLKDAAEFHILGTKKRRVDGPAIVVGEAHYGIDTKLPGMLYATVARPSVFGSRVKSFDPAPAQAVAGVRKVVEIPRTELPPLFGEERKENSGHQHYLWGGVAVVADSTWQAISGRRALAVEWEPGPAAPESTGEQRSRCAQLVQGAGAEQRKVGDPAAAFSASTKKVEAEYELPFVAHTPMEPPNCTAHVHDGKCEIWAPTQNAPGLATALSKALNLDPSALTIHVTLLGGGFGRRLNIDYGVEAALISQAAGVPVKVIWTREDDVRHDYYRPMSHHRLRAGLDAGGQVTSWLHHVAAPTTDGFYLGGDIPDTGGTEIAGAGLPNGSIPNYLLEASFLETFVPRGYWRSVDVSWNHFAVQSFVDEVAAASGKDPVALRRELLNTKQAPVTSGPDEKPVNVARLLNVLNLAAEKSGWSNRLPTGRGRGIAGLFAWDTYIAQVAEVTVSKDGSVRVDRLVCALDCGQNINPDMIAAQVEGGAAFGLTAAFHSEIRIDGGKVQNSNFNDYPILRINEMPHVEVHVVPSHETPGGIGEPTVPSIAPAVANAIFAATGKRLRRLPFQTDQLAQA